MDRLFQNVSELSYHVGDILYLSTKKVLALPDLSPFHFLVDIDVASIYRRQNSNGPFEILLFCKINHHYMVPLMIHFQNRTTVLNRKILWSLKFLKIFDILKIQLVSLSAELHA